MKQLTMQEAMEAIDEGRSPDATGHHIYRYVEGDITFYVGRSIRPFHRLREHLGQERMHYSPDSIGTFILDYLPHSLTWQVEVFTIEELEPSIDFSTIPAHLYATFAGQIEEEAIARYRPCLNSLVNSTTRTPLPARYIASQKIANKGVVLGR